jgi:hypothetical protein
MKLLSLLSILALASFVTSNVEADSPHFIKGPTASLDATTGDYCVSFKEAGLGNTPITYTITAGSEVFTFQCFTKSSNTPQGAPNNISLSNQSAQTTLTPRNGQITGSLCLLPEKDGASCQGNGLVLKLTAVDYKNVMFCDSTNNVCVSTSDFSATLAKPIVVQ